MSLGTQIGVIIFLIILIFFSMFFSAAEIAYSSVSKYTIEKNLNQNKTSARLIKKHYKSFGWTLATILLGNNLVNIAFSSLATTLISKLVFSDSNSSLVPIIATLIVTPIIVIFGEIIPKLLAKHHAYSYLSKIVYVMEFFNILLFPITFPFSRLALSSKTNITQKELNEIISIAARQKVLKEEGALVVTNALNLDSILVKDVMISRKNFTAVKSQDSIKSVLKVFQKSGHSRLPVLKNNRYIGVIMLKDIIYNDDQTNIESYLVKIPYVNKNIVISKTLEILRVNKIHMAFIVNKQKNYNVVVGLVTVEDIIEEVFGEIYDEHDNSKLINQISPSKWEIDGSVLMDTLSLLFKDIFFEKMDNLNIKQWVQKRINKKIKLNHIYAYKNKIVFKVIFNKKGQGTRFLIKRKWKS